MAHNREVNATNEEDKFEYDTYLDIGCLVHDLTSFLIAIGTYKS